MNLKRLLITFICALVTLAGQAQSTTVPAIVTGYGFSTVSNDGNFVTWVNHRSLLITHVPSGNTVLKYDFETPYGEIFHAVLSHQNNYIGILHSDGGCFYPGIIDEGTLMFTILEITNAHHVVPVIAYEVSSYHNYTYQDFDVESDVENGFLVKLKSGHGAFGYVLKFDYDDDRETYKYGYELGAFPGEGNGFYDFYYPRLKKIKGMDKYSSVLFYDLDEANDLCFALASYYYDDPVLDENSLLPSENTFGILNMGAHPKSQRPYFYPVFWDFLDSYQSEDEEYDLLPYNISDGENVHFLLPDYDKECVYGMASDYNIYKMMYRDMTGPQKDKLDELGLLRNVKMPFRFDFSTFRFDPVFTVEQVIADPPAYAFLRFPVIDAKLSPDKSAMYLVTYEEDDAGKRVYHVNRYDLVQRKPSATVSIPVETEDAVQLRFAPGQLLHLVAERNNGDAQELTVHTVSLAGMQHRTHEINKSDNPLFAGGWIYLDETNGLQLRLQNYRDGGRFISFSLGGIPHLEEYAVPEDSLNTLYEAVDIRNRYGSGWAPAGFETITETLYNSGYYFDDENCSEHYIDRGYNATGYEISGFENQENGTAIYDGSFAYNSRSVFRNQRAYLCSSRNIDIYDINSQHTIYSHHFHYDVMSVDVTADESLLVILTRDNRVTLIDNTTHLPVATIFLFNNAQDWVIVLPDNYYFGTRAATAEIAFQFNMDVLSADYFDLKYNRPDVVLKRLGYVDPKIIDIYEKAYHKRLKKLGLSPEMLKYDFDVPFVEIQNPSDIPVSTEEGTLRIPYKLFDARYPVLKMNVWINDVAIFGSKGIPVADNTKSAVGVLEIPLARGENNIVISCMNSIGVESNRESVRVNYRSGGASTDLYLLAIGVGSYQDARYNLTYPAKDARDMVAAFSAAGIYDSVHQLTLTDQLVTLEGIASAKSFFQDAGIDDQVILFVAGHGVLDENFNYYFASHDMNFQRPAERGIPYEAIESLLDGIKPLKKLLFMDTCHSGELEKDEIEETDSPVDSGEDIVFRNVGMAVQQKQQLGLQNTSELMKSLFTDLRKGTGATVISSAGGVEFAMESDKWKNGLFTYCLINGLVSGMADLDGSGQITVSEIQRHVQVEVNRLSGGKQTPSSRIENQSLDYRIW